jgi:hypothetical protein
VIVRLASFRSRLVWSVRFLLSMPCSSSWRRRRRACSAALRTVMATSAARLPAPHTAARARWRCGSVHWPSWSFPTASAPGRWCAPACARAHTEGFLSQIREGLSTATQ